MSRHESPRESVSREAWLANYDQILAYETEQGHPQCIAAVHMEHAFGIACEYMEEKGIAPVFSLEDISWLINRIASYIAESLIATDGDGV